MLLLNLSVFKSHCKVSCGSPCCAKPCGEDNHCVFNVDTNENVNSDSDEDEDQNFSIIKSSCNNIYLFASVVQAVVLGGEVYCPNAASAWEGIEYTDILYLVYRYSILQFMCIYCFKPKYKVPVPYT